MDAFTLDQFAVFVAVADEGSFAAAARRLNRAQSAITYAVQKLEEQTGAALFDRSAYRAAPTEAGRVLLPRARRILQDVAEYRRQAGSLAEGVEAALTLVVDAMVPMAPVAAALRAFHEAFPPVRLRMATEAMGAALQTLAEGRADIGVLSYTPTLTGAFERTRCGAFDLVAVAAPGHPLAALDGPIAVEALRDHVQLVIAGRTVGPDAPDRGIHAVDCWYLTDVATKHALLLAGVGWGSMPRHLVADDLAAGRLAVLRPARWEGADHMPRIGVVVAHLRDRTLGPAGSWLVGRLGVAAEG